MTDTFQVDEKEKHVEELKIIEQDLRKKNKHLENVIVKLEAEVNFLKTDNEAIYKQLDKKDELATTSLGEIRSYLLTIKDVCGGPLSHLFLNLTSATIGKYKTKGRFGKYERRSVSSFDKMEQSQHTLARTTRGSPTHTRRVATT
jgi:hypothetical protein